MKNTKRIILLCFLLGFSSIIFAQKSAMNFWQEIEKNPNLSLENILLGKMPKSFLLQELNIKALSKHLEQTSSDGEALKDNPILINIPTPDGRFEAFYIFQNTVVAPEVAHLYTIKTFEGYAKDDPTIPIRCDVSQSGFHAVVFKGSKTYVIEPLYKENKTTHIVFNKNELDNNLPIKCDFESGDREIDATHGGDDIAFRAPSVLRTFDLALVASGEYSQQYGGAPYSATNVLNSLASAVNTINGIYSRDLGVEFVSVTTAALVFPDPATDPFNTNNQGSLLAQNVIECDNALGNSGYDVGHLLVWANLGGLAAGGVVCWNPYKAQGFSGNNASFTTLVVDYACHEIGHQFNAAHNFASNECVNSVNGFRFEPGEGSSIMSYAGVCGPAPSYQSNSNHYFHSASIGTMNSYISTWGGCEANSTPGGGNANDPAVDAKSDITIPKQTPFVLVGSATDGNDPTNQLTYFWEQNDGGGSATTGSPNCNSTSQPLFKFEDPVSEDFKVFPDMNEILNGNNNGVAWQKLPCTARSLNFKLVVRDNNPNFGRVEEDEVVVTVANTGPFAITTPNGGQMWDGNSMQAVSWNVNGTNNHCPNVDILVSTDGGVNFSLIATGVTNDGTHNITVPNTGTSSARVLVQCSVGGDFKSASTFFDVSDANFTIDQALPVELLSFTAKKETNERVALHWRTALEINSKHFEVEKSKNGYDFSVWKIVTAKGSSFQEETYVSIDNNPFFGDNYYRLKQVDFDGNFTYSKIISINFEEANSRLLLFPNPAQNRVAVSGQNGAVINEVVIYNQLGQVVWKGETINNTIHFGSMTGGVYILETLIDEVKIREKLIIE
jgi:hypothetical protein